MTAGRILDGGVNPTLRNSYSTLNFPDQETEFLLEAGEHSLRVELDGDAGKELVVLVRIYGEEVHHTRGRQTSCRLRVP